MYIKQQKRWFCNMQKKGGSNLHACTFRFSLAASPKRFSTFSSNHVAHSFNCFFKKKNPQGNSKGLCKKKKDRKNPALLFCGNPRPATETSSAGKINRNSLSLPYFFFFPLLKKNTSPACDTSPPPRGGFCKATNPVALSDFLCGLGANREGKRPREATPPLGML